MRSALGIPTTLLRKGHSVLSPDGNPLTPLGLATFLQAGSPILSGGERAGLADLPFTFDEEPPPLTVCEFDTSHHEIHCRGLARGKLERIFHEHFTVYSVATQSADTQWIVTQFGPQTGAGAIATIVQSIADGHGVIDLAPRGVNGADLVFGKYARAISQLAGGALWIRPRFYFPSSSTLSNMVFNIGLISEHGAMPKAMLRYDSAQGPTFYGVTGSSSEILTPIPITVAQNTWYDGDIFLHGDQGYCSFWINGAGAHTAAAQVPSSALTPNIHIGTKAATQPHVYVDLMFVDVVRGADVRHPLLDPVLRPPSVS